METTFHIKDNITISKLDQPSLKVLENQLSYEFIMTKKYNQYAGLCEDTQLKNICHRSAEIHRKNYKALLDYLDTHQ